MAIKTSCEHHTLNPIQLNKGRVCKESTKYLPIFFIVIHLFTVMLLKIIHISQSVLTSHTV